MAMCPQSCASSCADENGQCTCLGTEYQTYYPTAVASSGDSSVAMATYDNGVLTVYGRAEGETDVTVRASLRQFTDGEATVHVQVEGTADGSEDEVSDAVIDVPQEAATPDDRQDVSDKTVMGRTIRNVRITDGLDAAAYLDEMAGVDGEIVFWSGDTYYHPDYSVTFVGDEYTADDVTSYDPALTVLLEPGGTLYQMLDGLDDFVIVDFAQRGDLPSTATVYADAKGTLEDGDGVRLFSYDEADKSLVLEDQEATVTGGYVSFDTDTGKTYVVSSRDLIADANSAVSDNSATGQASQGDTSNTTSTDQSTRIPPFVIVLIVAVIIAIVIVCVVVALLRRRSRGKDRTKDDKNDE